MKLALGPTLYDPNDPMGKMFFNILATFAEFEADLIRLRTREGMDIARARGNSAASSPNCLIDSSGNSAACMPPATIPSAISPSSSPSQDRPSIALSTGAFPLSELCNEGRIISSLLHQADDFSINHHFQWERPLA